MQIYSALQTPFSGTLLKLIPQGSFKQPDRLFTGHSINTPLTEHTEGVEVKLSFSAACSDEPTYYDHS